MDILSIPAYPVKRGILPLAFGAAPVPASHTPNPPRASSKNGLEDRDSALSRDTDAPGYELLVL